MGEGSFTLLLQICMSFIAIILHELRISWSIYLGAATTRQPRVYLYPCNKLMVSYKNSKRCTFIVPDCICTSCTAEN